VGDSWLHEAVCRQRPEQRQNLTELTVVCEVAGEWGKPTGQPVGPIPVH
jgi:hypothetical protein